MTAALSLEATRRRRWALDMGMAYFKSKKLLKQHDMAVFSSNYALYGDLSNRVMNVLATFAPRIEVYSIDEAFLDFQGFDRWDLTPMAVRSATPHSSGQAFLYRLVLDPLKHWLSWLTGFLRKRLAWMVCLTLPAARTQMPYSLASPSATCGESGDAGRIACKRRALTPL